jgi:hypothetical protein
VFSALADLDLDLTQRLQCQTHAPKNDWMYKPSTLVMDSSRTLALLDASSVTP